MPTESNQRREANPKMERRTTKAVNVDAWNGGPGFRQADGVWSGVWQHRGGGATSSTVAFCLASEHAGDPATGNMAFRVQTLNLSICGW